MTTKNEFLDALAEELRYLPPKQVNEVLKHYRDKIDVEIDYGVPEEKVIENLKTPEAIAKNIYEMHGVNYLNKRKRRTKIKNFFITALCLILLISCIALLIFGSVFIWRIIINMASLIIHAFTFNSIIDTLLTGLAVSGYLLVMVIVYIYILDLFIILTNELIIKILNCYDKTRGVTYPFMEFSFTLYFNEKTKKPKFLLKVLGICACCFVLFGICSIATKGYFYRSFNDIPNQKIEQEIMDDFSQININSNQIKIELKTDNTISNPKVIYEYEFDEMHYELNNGILSITNEDKKTYDLFNLIKSPTSKLIVYLPGSIDIDKINIDINYGDISVDNVNLENLQINILSGTLAIVNSSINKIDSTIYTGQVVSSNNIIDEIKLTQNSGDFTSSNDQYNKFNHHNESTNVKIVKSTITDYKLNNLSGTIYLEKLSGNNFTGTSSTSVNELYDLNYVTFDYTIQNTGKLTITRSKFTDLKVTSLVNSYQTLSYIKAEKILLKATSGLIVCENINDNYTNNQLDKLGDYRNYGIEYNNYNVVAPDTEIISEQADVTLTNNTFSKFNFELTKASSLITDVRATSIDMKLHDVGGQFNNLYAPINNIKLTSSSLTSSSKIEYAYDLTNEMIINLDMDGKSAFYYPEGNSNFILKK